MSVETSSGGPSWDDLVSSALLGTERKPLTRTRPADSGEMSALGALIANAASPAVALLNSAALLGAARTATLTTSKRQRVGTETQVEGDAETLAQAVAEPFSELLLETSTEASSNAVQLLDLLLSGNVAVADQRDQLISEWLAGCVRNQRIVPRRQILPILDRGTKSSEHRFDAARVVGARGRFIATHNPQWKWVYAKTTEATAGSDEGPITSEALIGADPLVKASLAATWRHRDPDAARIAITEALPHENAPDRTGFIKALSTGLSLDDEQLLELAVDDKAKSVREAARYLLSLLPNSAFSNRMTDRLAPLVTSKRFPRFSLTVQLPDVPTKEGHAAAFGAWERDGLPTVGRASEALQKLVECTPIVWWSSTFDRPLADIIAKLEASEFEREIVIGFCHAAVVASRQGLAETDWIVPLWFKLLERDSAPQPNGLSGNNLWWTARSSLVAIMSPSEVSSLPGLVLAGGHNFPRMTEALNALSTVPRSEFVVLNARVADDLVKAMVTHEQGQIVTHPNMGLVLASMTPAAVERLLESLTEWPSLIDRIRHLQAAQSISRALAQEFP